MSTGDQRAKDLRRAEEALGALGRLIGGNQPAAERARRAGVSIGRNAQRLLWFIVTEGPIRISDLARIAGTSDPIASRQVTALEAEGFIERLTSPEDGRVWLVRPTAAGRRVGQALRRATDEIFDEQMADWGATDLAALTDGLERLVRDLRKKSEPIR